MFLVHPTSIAAVDGSTVEFTCTASNSELIDYIVNGSLADSQEIVNIGLFKQQPTVGNTMKLRRNLLVTVSSLYNNTEILCRAFGPNNIGNKKSTSTTATLTVQGNSSSNYHLVLRKQ